MSGRAVATTTTTATTARTTEYPERLSALAGSRFRHRRRCRLGGCRGSSPRGCHRMFATLPDDSSPISFPFSQSQHNEDEEEEEGSESGSADAEEITASWKQRKNDVPPADSCDSSLRPTTTNKSFRKTPLPSPSTAPVSSPVPCWSSPPPSPSSSLSSSSCSSSNSSSLPSFLKTTFCWFLPFRSSSSLERDGPTTCTTTATTATLTPCVVAATTRRTKTRTTTTTTTSQTVRTEFTDLLAIISTRYNAALPMELIQEILSYTLFTDYPSLIRCAPRSQRVRDDIVIPMGLHERVKFVLGKDQGIMDGKGRGGTRVRRHQLTKIINFLLEKQRLRPRHSNNSNNNNTFFGIERESELLNHLNTTTSNNNNRRDDDHDDASFFTSFLAQSKIDILFRTIVYEIGYDASGEYRSFDVWFLSTCTTVHTFVFDKDRDDCDRDTIAHAEERRFVSEKDGKTACCGGRVVDVVDGDDDNAGRNDVDEQREDEGEDLSGLDEMTGRDIWASSSSNNDDNNSSAAAATNLGDGRRRETGEVEEGEEGGRIMTLPSSSSSSSSFCCPHCKWSVRGWFLRY